VTIKTIFTVAHVIVNTGVKASFDMSFGTFLWVFAFIDREILLSTISIDHLEFVFKVLVPQKFFVEH
jgi:hypothetical protein